MGQATIRLGAEQQRRAQVLNLLLEGKLTIRQAAAVLDRSERQVKRLKAAYRHSGPETLVHGNSGRVPWHVLPVAVRTRVVELVRGKYAGFNHQHLTEQSSWPSATTGHENGPTGELRIAPGGLFS